MYFFESAFEDLSFYSFLGVVASDWDFKEKDSTFVTNIEYR